MEHHIIEMIIMLNDYEYESFIVSTVILALLAITIGIVMLLIPARVYIYLENLFTKFMKFGKEYHIVILSVIYFFYSFIIAASHFLGILREELAIALLLSYFILAALIAYYFLELD